MKKGFVSISLGLNYCTAPWAHLGYDLVTLSLETYSLKNLQIIYWSSDLLDLIVNTNSGVLLPRWSRFL
jgi:hypothetical protein